MKNNDASEQIRQQAFDCVYGFNGTPHDGDRAMVLYRQAVEMGNRQAMGELAYFYLNGIYVEKDAGRAVRLYEAAVQSCASECWLYDLASCYETGDGVTADRTHAIDLYRQATRLGSGMARKALVRLGVVVPDEMVVV